MTEPVCLLVKTVDAGRQFGAKAVHFLGQGVDEQSERIHPPIQVHDKPANYHFLQFYQNYDATPGSERVLVVLPPDQKSELPRQVPQINIVTNWFEKLKERVPVP